MNAETDKEQNPYHRNHFIYNEEKDCFICPENKELPFYTKRYTQKNKTTKQSIQMQGLPRLVTNNNFV